ncbi:hypothetical protein Q7P35_003085 [Cladosporium inversicolor]
MRNKYILHVSVTGDTMMRLHPVLRLLAQNTPTTSTSKQKYRKMNSKPVMEMLARNRDFARNHQPSPQILKMAPKTRASGEGGIVISCADPRVPCDQILGFDETINPAVVRNAGGRVSDAIRTIAVMQTIIEPSWIIVMHHTDCGMTHYFDPMVRETLLKISPSEKEQIKSMSFGEITGSLEDSVREDIAILRKSPFIKRGTHLVGLTYNVETGEVAMVE